MIYEIANEIAKWYTNVLFKQNADKDFGSSPNIDLYYHEDESDYAYSLRSWKEALYGEKSVPYILSEDEYYEQLYIQSQKGIPSNKYISYTELNKLIEEGCDDYEDFYNQELIKFLKMEYPKRSKATKEQIDRFEPDCTVEITKMILKNNREEEIFKKHYFTYIKMPNPFGNPKRTMRVKIGL